MNARVLELWPVLAAAFVIAFSVTPALRNSAVRLNVLDTSQDLRRVHARPVPRLGGIAIVVGAYGALVVGLAVPVTRAAILEDGWTVLGLLLGGSFVAAAGVYDDVMGARPMKKLGIEIVAAVLLYSAGFRIVAFDDPFGKNTIALGALSFPVTILWICGVANAINLIDGLDGLAGGIAAVAAAAMCALGAWFGNPTAVLMSLTVLGSVVGFVIYNVSPASIFMGDTGSLFLGTMLAAIPLLPRHAATRSMPITAVLVVLGIPILDTVVAMARRAARGTPIFMGDRDHLHHRLLALGLTPREAVLVLWTLSGLFAAAGVYMARTQEALGRLVVLVVSVLAIIALLSGLGYLGPPDVDWRAVRRRNRERRRHLRASSARLRHSRTLEEIDREINAIAPVLDAVGVRLRPPPGRLRREGAVRSLDSPSRALFPLDAMDPRSRLLEIQRRAGLLFDRDTEVAIEILCQNVARALDRIERRRAVTLVPVAIEPSRRRRTPAGPLPRAEDVPRGPAPGFH